MKDKTRCIISIILSVLPIVLVAVSSIGYLPWLSMRVSDFFLRFLTLPIFSEQYGLFLFPSYVFLTAVFAYGMQSFAESDFSREQEHLYLAFPMTAGVFSVLNLVFLFLLGGTAVYALLSFLSAIALLCWLIWNIKTLAAIRHTEQSV
ncbi:MAG: hypothetical protein ACI4LI_07495 [Candidatus Fimenecus sp.]